MNVFFDFNFFSFFLLRLFNIEDNNAGLNTRKYGLRDRSTLKRSQHKLSSDYAQSDASESKDDEEEQIKRATEESLRDYHKQSSFDVSYLL